MVKRQLERELGGPRYKRGSEQRLGWRDQLGLLPGQRGGMVIVDENVPARISLGSLAVLVYAAIQVTTVNYDYTIHEFAKNCREHVGASAVAQIAARDAYEERESRRRQDDLRYGFLSDAKDMGKIKIYQGRGLR